MTEQNAPKGEPYGLAVAALQQHSTALPACVVVHPDHVLWPHSSDSLSLHSFQLLEQAAAVLGAITARQIPIALLVPSSNAQLVHECLEQANLAPQFAAVVEYASEPQVTQQQPEQQPHIPQQQQQQQRPAAAGSMSNSWAEAANSLKAQIGAPWQQMLFFSADPLAVRQANRLGMAAAKVPVATGLSVSSLQAGLDVYSSKLESDRGY